VNDLALVLDLNTFAAPTATVTIPRSCDMAKQVNDLPFFLAGRGYISAGMGLKGGMR